MQDQVTAPTQQGVTQAPVPPTPELTRLLVALAMAGWFLEAHRTRGFEGEDTCHCRWDRSCHTDIIIDAVEATSDPGQRDI